MLKFANKKHILYKTIVLSAIVCLLSVYLSFFIRILFSLPIHLADILMSLSIPAIIAPTIIYIILEQSYQLYHSKKQIEELVNKDALTQIYNKRYFESLAEDIFLSGRTCAIILIDIDDFKRINDQYGHMAGDFAMKQTAAIIKAQLRETDIVARIGGDEFAIICINANAQYGKDIAERIRNKVENAVYSYLNQEIYLTVSVGCVSNKDMAYSLDELIRNADDALYRSKESGKNKVTSIECA